MATIGSIGRSQVALQLSRVAQSIIITRLIVDCWGKDRFSDWVLLSSVAAYASLCDLGIQSLISNRLLLYAKGNDRIKFNDLISSAAQVYARLAIIVIIFVYPCGYLLYSAGAIEVHAIGSQQAISAFAGLALAAFLGAILTIYGGIYASKGDSNIGINCVTAQIVLQTITVTIFMFLGAGPASLAFGYLSSNLALLVAVPLHLSIRYSLKLDKAIWARHLPVVETLKLSLFYFLNPLLAQTTISAPILAISLIGGNPIAIIWLTTTRTLVGLGRQFTTQFANGASIELTRLLISDQPRALAKEYRAANRLICALAGFLGGVTLVNARKFTEIWTSGQILTDQEVINALVLAACFATPSFLMVGLLQVNGRPRVVAASLTIQLVLSLGFSVVFGSLLGSKGIIWAFSVFEILANVCLLIYSSSTLGRGFAWAAMVQSYCYVGLALLTAAGISAGVDKLLPVNLNQHFALSIGIGGGMCSLVFPYFGFDQEGRRRLSYKVRRSLRGKL